MQEAPSLRNEPAATHTYGAIRETTTVEYGREVSRRHKKESFTSIENLTSATSFWQKSKVNMSKEYTLGISSLMMARSSVVDPSVWYASSAL